MISTYLFILFIKVTLNLYLFNFYYLMLCKSFFLFYFILFNCIKSSDFLYFFVSFCSVSLYFYRIIWPMRNRGLVMPGMTTPPPSLFILRTRNLGWVMSGMQSQASVNFTFLALHSLPKHHVNFTNIVHFIHGVNFATETKSLS